MKKENKESLYLFRDLKRTLILSVVILILGCNSNSEVFLFEMNENWGEWHAGNTTSIQYELRAYKKGKDTIYYTTNYYPNGIVKCKAIQINDRLETVEFVNDTIGNRIDFGEIKNGNGYVKRYNFQGVLEQSGKYINGNKEGWWYYYHFSGEILDSTLFKKGYNISDTLPSSIDKIFGNTRQYKNNFYH